MLDKTFDPSAIEQAHYKKWESKGVFAADPHSAADPYTIMMPPPNVTGSLHIGHALNHTLQDILVRYHRLKGRDTLWQPGTDHASIAVHMVLERQLAAEGKERSDLGREKFMEKAWKWKEHSGNTITNQLRRLGTTPDWGRERFTMDEGLSEAVTKVFVQLYKEGLIYRAKRLVHWDPERKTVISDLEVNMKETKGHLWHIQYDIEGAESRTITVATTRPETMLGDTAIAVHPEDERYKDLVGKYAVLPIVGRLIPIVADGYADPEAGSGAVKITPAHDFNDFEVGQRHNLEMINIFNEDAHLNENVPENYQGMERYEARKKIVAELDEMDVLVKIEDHTHAVPYGERSGVVIEPFLTEQWYCDSPTLAKPAAQAVRDGRTKFYPKQYENMYFAWVDNQLPWCISRQLWWGHQIPAWYDVDGNVYVAATEAEAYKEAGKGVKLTRDEDVLDTWFSSALWPFSTLGWPEKTPELAKYYPGDVLVTGFDIITFWVSRMMMMSLHFMDDVPFKDVYIHALVRDEKGQKMSKSKGNVIDPLDIIEKYGTDALRFTLVALAAQGRDIKLGEQRIEGYRNFATKLWNAARYCEMNNCLPQEGFDPASAVYTPNKWLVQSVKKLDADIDKALSAYRFNDAAQVLYQFIWNVFCDWYLEIVKPVLNSDNPDKAMVAEVKATTGWALEQILRILNPFMPYITEELYTKLLGGHEPLMSQSWPDYDGIAADDAPIEEIEWLIALITEIRSLRADMNVPAGAQICLLVKDASKTTLARLEAYSEIIKKLARVGLIEQVGSPPKGSVQSVLGEATLILPIADLIDLNKERTRLKKEVDKLKDEIKKIDQKLENKQFVSNAPEEIVEQERQRRVKAEMTMEKFSAALRQLEAA